MTQPLLQPSVDILSVSELRLVEEPPPQLSPEHQRAGDRVWDEKAQANPSLFVDVGKRDSCSDRR